MRVVAYPALLEHGGLVSVDLRKTIPPMAVETAAFEDKTATPVQTVALGTLHTRNRRMLVKRLKRRRRIRTNKKMHLLFAAFPEQNQRVQAGWRFKRSVKHIWKRLFGLDRDTVQLEFPRRRSGNQIDLPAFMG